MSPKTNDHTLPPDELGEPRRIVLAAARKRTSPAPLSVSTVTPKPRRPAKPVSTPPPKRKTPRKPLTSTVPPRKKRSAPKPAKKRKK